jgi:hypothetical protein
MRTTISIDDHVITEARRLAASKGQSLSAFIAAVLDDAIKRTAEPPPERPFRLVTVGGGGPYPGVDLDRTGQLMVAEDETRYG